MDKIKNLYIIGNGFDCHHGIDSKYSSYKSWLSNYDPELYEELLSFYEIENDEWWWQFELNLGTANLSNYILQTSSQNQPNYASDEFRDRDYYIAFHQAEKEVESLMIKIKRTFKDWVLSLKQEKSVNKVKLKKDDCFYINFNYTHTLQEIYNIHPNKIFHIHGEVDSDELIIGHNKTYEDLHKDTLDCAYEDYVTQLTRDATVSALLLMRKNVEDIILSNENLFYCFKDVEHIYVYGFSFSLIDLPYIDKIIDSINKSQVQWTISYYTNDDACKILNYMKSKKVPKELWNPLIRLEDI